MTISFVVGSVCGVMLLAAPVSAFNTINFTGDGDPSAAGFDAGSNSFDIDTDENGAAHVSCISQPGTSIPAPTSSRRYWDRKGIWWKHDSKSSQTV